MAILGINCPRDVARIFSQIEVAGEREPLGQQHITLLHLGDDVPIEQLNERFASLIPNPKRMGRADEYAQLALQIVENDFLNGYTIRLDGAQRF